VPDDTILCWTWPESFRGLLASPNEVRHITVKDCKDWLDEGDGGRYKLADFLRHRLRERYVDPVLKMGAEDKNGFPIMAISCLLIEAFETFEQGWDSTEGKVRSPLAFCYFFDREERFHDFKGHGQTFYKQVRCGILHQGETTGGWTIRREGDLFESRLKRLNATKFHGRLEDVINDYCDRLKTQPLESQIWRNFKAKLKATFKNCEG
jgi:hypothetical protein